MTQLKEAFFGAFTPDSEQFVAVGKAKRVIFYDEAGEVKRIESIPFASAISISNDGQRLALTSPEHKLSIHHIDGTQIALQKTNAEASDGLWTPDSSHVLIPFWNKELHIVNSESGKTEEVKAIGKSPRLQASAHGFTLTHWRIDEYLHPRIETFDWNFKPTAEAIELSTDFSKFGVSPNLEFFWGITPEGLCVLDRDQNPIFIHDAYVRSAAISPSGAEIAIVEPSGQVTRRSLPDGEVISIETIPYATQPHYSPDETKLAITSHKTGAIFRLRN